MTIMTEAEKRIVATELARREKIKNAHTGMKRKESTKDKMKKAWAIRKSRTTKTTNPNIFE